MVNSGIPLCFRCFKGKNPSEACQTKLIEESVQYVYELLKDKSKNINIIFLADRWFDKCKLMKYIEETGATYCIGVKSWLTFYIHNYGEIAGYTKDVPPKEKEEQYFERVTIVRHGYYRKRKKKNDIKIKFYKKKDKSKRIISLFNTGLMYFNLCFNSYGIPKIKCDFILYEV